METEEVLADAKSFKSVLELKALNKFIEELISDLKNCEETAIANERKLMKIKVAKWQLKSRVIYLMSYYKFLNQLEKNHKEWESSAEIETKIDDMQSQHLSQKRNYGEICSEIDKLKAVVEEAEKIYSLKCEVDKRLGEFHLKKQKYETLKSEFDKKASLFNGGCNVTEAAKVIETQKKQIDERKKQIENLEREMEATHTTLKSYDLEILKKLESFYSAEEQTIAQQESQMEQKYQRQIDIYATLSGIRVLSTNEGCDRIELHYGSEMGYSQAKQAATFTELMELHQDSSITVELRYLKQKPPHPTKLTDVKIDDCFVPVDDLISRAIADNNFPRVIPELQMRLENSQKFAKEIKKLRKTAAIDWIPGKNTLQLIVGNYVCTLLMSISEGQIKLVEVKGPKEKDITDMQPVEDNPSVTDWVNHLQTILEYAEDY